MTGKNVFSNFIWRFLERCGAQGVSFVVSLILARLLDPSVYGAIALVTVFTTILSVIADGGLGGALIQKKDADDLDFSSVFFFNVVVFGLMYFLLFLFAPLIADYYNLPELVPVIRVLSLTLPISAVKNIQHSYVAKNMMFKRFFYATLGGTVGAAILGIYMAYNGYGIWALVVQNIFNQTVDTIILWMTVKWRHKKQFSFMRIRRLFSFGWKMAVSDLVNSLYEDIRSLIIGKVYTTSDLAFYNKGNQLPNLIVTNVNSSINSVLFPALSAEQDKIKRVREMTRQAMKISSYVMLPMMMGFAVCAEPLVRIILTEKWLPAVPYIRLFCLMYAFYPIRSANLGAIKAIGRSDVYLKLEIIKDVIGITAIIISMRISVYAMAVGYVATTIICQIINAIPNQRMLQYGYVDQIKDILPQIILTIIMGGIVYLITLITLFQQNDYLTLAVQIFVGVVVYIVGSYFGKIESFNYILDVIRKVKTKER